MPSDPRSAARVIDDALLQHLTRRHLFAGAGVALGSLALADLLRAESADAIRETTRPDPGAPMAVREPHFAPKAKRVIFLFMAGGPSQFELFADKPKLVELSGQEPPESLMRGRQFAFLKGGEKLLGSKRTFARHGDCGMDVSELLPFTAKMVDDLCWVRSCTTDVFNHGPAKLFMNTGFQVPGRPSMGAWVTYGIGSPSRDLPGFVVLQSGPRGPRAGAALWSSGFLPSSYQGVPFRGQGDAILDLKNPVGVTPERQRELFDFVRALNEERLAATHDPEIQTRINAYEMAYRMQSSAPELMDLSQESAATLAAYGVQPGKPSFANNCLLARRLVERGVRFVQLYHTNWDHHGGAENLEGELEKVTREIDQPCHALVRDLQARGLLDDTLVIWGGEFGRTPMGELRAPVGRDHHVEGFTMWFAGGGTKPGTIIGETDELGLGVVRDKVHVHDINATILHLLGFDHERLTYRFQGRDYRLTDVHGSLVPAMLA
ncbi:MAG: hypothetical protein RLZZ111_1588 [Planctomycetota bacterium]|jgi:hypothetical protein